MRLVPDHVQETVAIIKVPNYQERFQISELRFDNMKHFGNAVGLEPVLRPVHYKDTMICYKNSTKKKFVSHTYYEPKMKPRAYCETLVIFPKRPIKVFLSGIEHHIDECRKWFKTSMEFTAKTYTTKRIEKPSKTTPVCNGDIHTNGGFDHDGPGASQIFLPRFNKDPSQSFTEQEIENNVMQHERINGDHALLNGEILNGEPDWHNGGLLNGGHDLVNGDILLPEADDRHWV